MSRTNINLKQRKNFANIPLPSLKDKPVKSPLK